MFVFFFTLQLSALYEVKPPISKAKMNSLTRGAIKAIKFYKHVVQSVEKFIQKVRQKYQNIFFINILNTNNEISVFKLKMVVFESNI